MNLPSQQRSLAACNCAPRTSNPKTQSKISIAYTHKTFVARAVNFCNNLGPLIMCSRPLRHARITRKIHLRYANRDNTHDSSKLCTKHFLYARILRGIHDTSRIRTKRPQCARNLQDVHEMVTLRIRNHCVSNKIQLNIPKRKKMKT